MDYLVGSSRLMPQGGGSAERQLEELRSFCKVLLEELSWALSSLGPGNFTERGLAALAERIAGLMPEEPAVRIETKEYTGDGQYGLGHAVRAAFSFQPTVVLVEAKYSSNMGPLVIPAGVSSTYCKSDDSGSLVTVMWAADGTALQWYNDYSSTWMLNNNNKDYIAIAIGTVR